MSAARPARRIQRTARRRREGAVLLIVLLILMMATGSALFAMQATFFEQRSATSYAEASWTRAIAEGAAMAGLTVADQIGPGNDPGLDARWQDGGGRSMFSVKYGLPSPMAGTSNAASNPDVAKSFDCTFWSTGFTGTPVGLLGYLDPVRDGVAPYGAFTRQYRVPNARVLLERWSGLGLGRTRTIITGIGETALPVDPVDMDGQRGLHETVGMARAYLDQTSP